MGDKKDRPFLSADVDFPRELIEAFKKPLRTTVQPIEIGSVVEMAPAHNSRETQTLYGIVMALHQNAQDMLIAPIQPFSGTYTSKIADYDCFVSDHEELASMGMKNPIVVNIAQTQTHHLANDQISEGADYLFLTKNQDYPLIRATGKAPATVMEETEQSLSDYMTMLKTQVAAKPKISDTITESRIPSPSARLAEWGLPDCEIH